MFNFLKKDKKRNNSAPPALKETEDILKQGVFNSQPASQQFKQSLKKQILEKRRKQEIIMKQPSLNIASIKALFRPKRMVPVAIVALVILVVLSSIYIWRPSMGGPFDDFSKLLIDPVYAEDNFSVEATASDSLGVESDTAFMIKSKDVIEDPDLLRKNITLSPESEFDFEVVSGQEFKVTPKQTLQDRTVYNLKINSAYINSRGLTVERDYSWAFQVKDRFKIYGTLPRDQVDGVPTNMGIEIYFSHEGYHNFEKHVSIVPAVKYKFEKHGRTLVLVPDQLQPGTVYTVTVDQDLPIENSDERLDRDFVFQFETKRDEDDSPYRSFGISKNYGEFSPRTTPYFQVYEYGNGSRTKYQVAVYNLGGLENYRSLIEKKAEIPEWASYQSSRATVDLGGASKVMETEMSTTESESGYSKYLVLPESLDVGFYALEVRTPDDRIEQAFFQVSDIAAYINVLQDRTLVWLKDIQTGASIDGATVKLAGSGREFSSDREGLVVFDTDELKTVEVNYYDEIDQKVKDSIIVEHGSERALFSLGGSKESKSSYWVLLKKDRSVYRTDDTVRLWGFLQDRDGRSLENEDISLKLVKNEYRNYYLEPLVLQQEKVELDAGGTFSAEFELRDLKSGYYFVELYAGDQFVNREYIEVQDYFKPEYQIEVTPEKYAVYGGEDINLKLETSFFEGTPVPYLDLSVDGKNVITDKQGEASAGIGTLEGNCSKSSNYCQSVSHRTIKAYPTKAELGEVSGSTRVVVARFDTLGSVRVNELDDDSAEITTKFEYFNFDKINGGEGNIYYDYHGPVRTDVDFRAEIYEVGYEKQEIGTYYDFINKLTRKRYSYHSYKNKVGEYSGNTGGNGEHRHQFNLDKDKNYRIKVFARDTRGRSFFTSVYYSRYKSDFDNDFYELEIKDKQTTDDKDLNEYSIGEQVKVGFVNNGEQLAETSKNDFLYLKMQRGLRDFRVSADSQYGFKFSEQDMPNLRLKGVWFDGDTFHSTYENRWYASSDSGYIIKVAENDRELTIEVSSDKQAYKPGQEATLHISVKDREGKGVRSGFNISLVDEALYKIREDYNSGVLVDLYRTVEGGEIFTYGSHEKPKFDQGGAEGGAGCFLAGTKITMADGSVKNIQDIVVGDEIATYDSSRTKKLIKAKVVETFQHVVPGYIVINDSIKVTPEHRFFINDGWQMIGQAKVGDFMLNESGDYVRIQSIEKVDKTVAVFNFHIENYHTYLANGIYVHNEKGGARVDFRDTALFFSGRTDDNGRGEVTFKLPDNFTSWRINAKAVSKSLLAGQSTGNIKVSKPVFVLGTYADEYLTSDKPIVKLRAYGNALKQGDKVDFSLSVENLGVKEKRSGQAYVPEYFNLGSLRKGVFPLYHSVQAEAGGDLVVKPISVIDSRLKKEYTDFYNLSKDLELTVVPEGRFKMIFSDQSQGKFYNRLTSLGWTWGERIDQKLARVLAERYKEIYFDEQKFKREEIDKDLFQMQDGGIALLPYADSDFELSAKVAALVPGFFDRNALANYFYGFYNQTDLNQDEAALSLYGLSALEEPVLYPVRKLAEREDLSVKNRLYVALAAEKLGDAELARDILNQLLQDHGEEFESMARVKPNDNSDEILSATSLAANLAAGLNSSYHERLWNYVQKNYTKEILLNLEELLYIKQGLKHLKPGSVSFTLTIDGKRIERQMEKGRTFALSITPEQYEKMTVEQVDGKVGVTVSYFDVPEQIDQRRGPNSYASIGKKYLVDGQETNSFKEDDVVQIVLDPYIDPASIDGAYTVTDILPSGLSIIKHSAHRSEAGYDNCSIYPYQSRNNVIKVNVYKNSHCSTRSYYARVNSLGEFTVEPAVIQSVNSQDIINYSDAGRITIQNVE